jgi:hypothetical protein
MSKALWILRLPEESKIVVEEGEKISLDDKLAVSPEETFFSPVSGKVVEVEEKRIKIKFSAKKIVGQPLGQNHSWGKIEWRPGLVFSQLDRTNSGQIIFVTKLNSILFSKASALGVKGFISCLVEKDLLEKKCSLPVLIVPEKGEELDILEKQKGISCLLDARNGCLLIPQKR